MISPVGMTPAGIRQYTYQEYRKKCRNCKHNGKRKFCKDYRNRCNSDTYIKCPYYVPDKFSRLSLAHHQAHLNDRKEVKDYVDKKTSGYCETHNCKTCSLYQQCVPQCVEDVTIKLTSEEIGKIAFIHEMLKTICDARFGDCTVCPLSVTGDQCDCHFIKFINENLQILDILYNDIGEC